MILKRIAKKLFTISKHFILKKNILKENASEQEKRKILKQFLQLIEIETFSFCNRKCWFCPNSKIDRQSQNIEMPEEKYLKILSNLKEIEYDGVITYSRYNEPLAKKDLIIKRRKQAKEYCPNAFLYTHTNGDYLTKEYLFELADAGIELLAIQCYLDENEEFDIENIIKPKMQKTIEKIGLEYEILTSSENQYSIKFILPEKYNKITAAIDAINFKNIGVNRGESIDTIQGVDRVLPCLSPFYRMYIDYDGSVMPCCQVRHDIPEHKHMICGNVTHSSLFDIFMNNNFTELRKNLIEKGKKIPPCRSCNATTCENVFHAYGCKIFSYQNKK